VRKRLLSLYPEAWRERYGEEMSALLDETPTSVSGTLDLLRGALSAHLRPLAAPAPKARARGTVAGVLGCFIIFLFVGSAFAKTTENDGYTERLHPLLGVSHSVILDGAIVAIAALALAAAPLAVASVLQARRTRDPELAKLVALPPAAIAVFAGSVGLLVLALNADHHVVGVGAWLLFALAGLCGAGCGFVCWAAPRALMRRVDIPRGAYAFSVPALALVTLCMVVVAIATGVFLVGIVSDAPGVGASGNGPGQLIDVTSSIALLFAGMLGLGGLAALSAARGLRSLREI
jgi:hypothetical protein